MGKYSFFFLFFFTVDENNVLIQCILRTLRNLLQAILWFHKQTKGKECNESKRHSDMQGVMQGDRHGLGAMLKEQGQGIRRQRESTYQTFMFIFNFLFFTPFHYPWNTTYVMYVSKKVFFFRKWAKANESWVEKKHLFESKINCTIFIFRKHWKIIPPTQHHTRFKCLSYQSNKVSLCCDFKRRQRQWIEIQPWITRIPHASQGECRVITCFAMNSEALGATHESPGRWQTPRWKVLQC